MAPEMPREQEQSIKARKRELFDAESPSLAPRKRFSEYLNKTPPAPLPTGQKAILWTVGAVVLLLFIFAMMTIPSPGRKSSPRPGAGVRAAGR